LPKSDGVNDEIFVSGWDLDEASQTLKWPDIVMLNVDRNFSAYFEFWYNYVQQFLGIDECKRYLFEWFYFLGGLRHLTDVRMIWYHLVIEKLKLVRVRMWKTLLVFLNRMTFEIYKAAISFRMLLLVFLGQKNLTA
jgi:hypothetical protein